MNTRQMESQLSRTESALFASQLPACRRTIKVSYCRTNERKNKAACKRDREQTNTRMQTVSTVVQIGSANRRHHRWPVPFRAMQTDY